MNSRKKLDGICERIGLAMRRLRHCLRNSKYINEPNITATINNIRNVQVLDEISQAQSGIDSLMCLIEVLKEEQKRRDAAAAVEREDEKRNSKEEDRRTRFDRLRINPY